MWTLTLRHFPRLITIETLLGVGVLAVVPFLVGSPRNEAGDTGPQHLGTPAVLGIGVVLVVMLTLSFFAAVKASEVLGRTAEGRSDQLHA